MDVDPNELLERSWPEYRRLVLSELQRIDAHSEKISQSLNDIRVQVGMLQVKASIFGAAAGAGVALVLQLALKTGGLK